MHVRAGGRTRASHLCDNIAPVNVLSGFYEKLCIMSIGCSVIIAVVYNCYISVPGLPSGKNNSSVCRGVYGSVFYICYIKTRMEIFGLKKRIVSETVRGGDSAFSIGLHCCIFGRTCRKEGCKSLIRYCSPTHLLEKPIASRKDSLIYSMPPLPNLKEHGKTFSNGWRWLSSLHWNRSENWWQRSRGICSA